MPNLLEHNVTNKIGRCLPLQRNAGLRRGLRVRGCIIESSAIYQLCCWICWRCKSANLNSNPDKQTWKLFSHLLFGILDTMCACGPDVLWIHGSTLKMNECNVLLNTTGHCFKVTITLWLSAHRQHNTQILHTMRNILRHWNGEARHCGARKLAIVLWVCVFPWLRFLISLLLTDRSIGCEYLQLDTVD